MVDSPTDVLYLASIWAAVLSTVLCVLAIVHMRLTRCRAHRGDEAAARSAVLPALEPVVWLVALAFAVRAGVLNPAPSYPYPNPPAWFNNAQYLGVGVDSTSCWLYFLYWFTFETVSQGLALLHVSEWLSPRVLVMCAGGGVLSGLLLAGITTFGFNYQNMGLPGSTQRICDFLMLGLGAMFYIVLLFGWVPRRKAVIPFCVYSISWRTFLAFAIAGAVDTQWPGVVVHIIAVVLLPFMAYMTLAADSQHWRDLFTHDAQRRRSRMSSTSSSALSSVRHPLMDGTATRAGRARGSSGSRLSASTMSSRASFGALTALMSYGNTNIIDFAFLNVRSQVLGRGHLATVFKGYFKGAPVAVKSYRPQHVDLLLHVPSISTEIAVCTRLEHANIVKFHGVCFQPPRVHLVFDLCELGSLQQDMSTELKLSLASDAVNAVMYLHACDPVVVHHDIKSANFMLTAAHSSETPWSDPPSLEWTMKLADFGESSTPESGGTLSDFGDDEFATSAECKGTAAWMAPEVISGGSQTTAVDVYSLGVVLWELFTGLTPFQGESRLTIMRRVQQEQARPPFPHNTAPNAVPEQMRRLIERCWATDAVTRPTAGEVMDELRVIRTELCGGAPQP